ncbi:MAG: DUF2799 domain-containing protein [Bdellovibrionota bacterium]
MKRSYALLATLVFLSSCASELKRRCESTNWFEYGQSVALSGKRLNADNFVGQCKKEKVDIDEAQLDVGFKAGMGRYCTAEGAADTGRKGDVFSDDLCDPATVSSLRKEHQKGVLVYCKPENGYEQGALGKTYNNVCSEKLEPAFLKQFKRGKRVYVSGVIESKESEIQAAQDVAEDASRSASRLRAQLTGLVAAQTIALARNSSPEVQSQIDSERSSLESRIYSEESRRDQKEREITKLRNDIRELRVQLGASLDTSPSAAPGY